MFSVQPRPAQPPRKIRSRVRPSAPLTWTRQWPIR